MDNDKLSDSVRTIEYKETNQKEDTEILSDNLEDRKQTRNLRCLLFLVLIAVSTVFVCVCLSDRSDIFSLVNKETVDIPKSLVNGKNFASTNFLLELIVFVHASLVIIPLLACVRLINKEKETTEKEAKDMGIIAKLLSSLSEIVAGKN